MKRFVHITTVCVVIVALTVDSVAACWLFSRRVYCRPCPPSPRYSSPVVYSSCTTPGAAWEPMPGAIESMPGNSMRIPWTQPMPGRATQPTPAETRTSPSDRPGTFRETTPEREPMPEPRGTTPDTTPAVPDMTPAVPETTIPETTPAAPDNPFDPSAATPTTPSPADTVTPPTDTTTPTPGATELDDPFRSTTPPRSTDTTPPTRTTPDENPFPPPAPSGATTPTDDPLAPSGTRPPAQDPLTNPFGQPTGGTNPTSIPTPTDTPAPTDNPLTPRASETQPSDPPPSLDNPFGPPPGATGSTGSTPSDPFGAPSGATPAASDGGSATPMTSIPASPSENATAADPQQSAPAVEDPFAEPAGPRLSAVTPKPEPADAMRVWTDVTGKHQVRGRMKLILADQQKVRILKETGKYTTVPFAKLCQQDRTFVARHAIEPSALLAER